jgi:mRNA-degrading endonuclease HigB of HigAB toxin-antitoxin module
MKVHLIKRQTAEDYAAGHARSRSAFALWLTALKYADWNTPADIQRTFGAADLLGAMAATASYSISAAIITA